MSKLLVEKPHSTIIVSTKTGNGLKPKTDAEKLDVKSKLVFAVICVQMFVGGAALGNFLRNAETLVETEIHKCTEQQWILAYNFAMVAEVMMGFWLIYPLFMKSSKGIAYWVAVSLALFIISELMLSCRVDLLYDWNTEIFLFQTSMGIYIFEMFLVSVIYL